MQADRGVRLDGPRRRCQLRLQSTALLAEISHLRTSLLTKLLRELLQHLRNYLQLESKDKRKEDFDFEGWENYADHHITVRPLRFLLDETLD